MQSVGQRTASPATRHSDNFRSQRISLTICRYPRPIQAATDSNQRAAKPRQFDRDPLSASAFVGRAARDPRRIHSRRVRQRPNGSRGICALAAESLLRIPGRERDHPVTRMARPRGAATPSFDAACRGARGRAWSRRMRPPPHRARRPQQRPTEDSSEIEGPCASPDASARLQASQITLPRSGNNSMDRVAASAFVSDLDLDGHIIERLVARPHRADRGRPCEPSWQ